MRKDAVGDGVIRSPGSSQVLLAQTLKADVLIDSGCEVHLIDPDLLKKAGLNFNKVEKPLNIIAAGGHRLEHLGWQKITLCTASGQRLLGRFEVAKVGKIILSVSQLADRGTQVLFAGAGEGGSKLVHPKGWQIPLQRRGGIYCLSTRTSRMCT